MKNKLLKCLLSVMVIFCVLFVVACNKDEKLPEGISIMQGSFKAEYQVGEQLNLANAKILISIKGGDSEEKAITQDMVSGFDTSTAGTNRELTVTYKDKDTTLTAPFLYNVLAPTHVHSYGAWQAVRAASCTVAGEEKRVCANDATHTETREIAKIAHTTNTVTTPATCTEDGATTVSCSVCETEISNAVIAKLRHSYGAWQAVRAASCTVAGEEKRVCANDATHTETREIAKIAHTTNTVTTPATCTEDGATTVSCSVCKTKISETAIEKLGHKEIEMVTKDASCTEAGTTTFTCKRCDAERTTAIPQWEHRYNSGTAHLGENCAEESYTVFTCDLCKGTRKEDIVRDHIWDAGTITPATCAAAGNTVFNCAVCNESKQEEILKLSHIKGAGVTAAPTCIAVGSTVYSCTICKEQLGQESIEKLNHEFHNVVTKTPTCTVAGTLTATCKVCNTAVTEDIAILPHQESEVTTTQEATCTATGIKTFACKVCHEERTEVLPMYQHVKSTTWQHIAADGETAEYWQKTCVVCNLELETVTANPTMAKNTRQVPEHTHQKDNGTVIAAATCEQTGILTHKCWVCGELMETLTIPMLTHSFGNETFTTKPTCTTAGELNKTCTMCNLEESVVIEKYSHSYTLWGIVKPSQDCSIGDIIEYPCLYCDDVRKETAAPRGHIENCGNIKKGVSCEEDGSKEINCLVCNKLLRTESIKKYGHIVYGGIITTPETCTEDGVRTFSCYICKEVQSTAPVAHRGHIEYTKIKKHANCTKEGTVGTFCRACNIDLQKDSAVAAHGHTASLKERITESTCAVQGGKAIHCKECNILMETIEVFGLKEHTFVFSAIVEATDNADAYNLSICSVCEERHEEQLLTHKITFVADGQTVVVKRIRDKQTLTAIPTVPRKEGFMGVWDTTGFSNITAGFTVTAVYTEGESELTDAQKIEKILQDSLAIKQYTVTFGGESAAVEKDNNGNIVYIYQRSLNAEGVYETVGIFKDGIAYMFEDMSSRRMSGFSMEPNPYVNPIVYLIYMIKSINAEMTLGQDGNIYVSVSGYQDLMFKVENGFVVSVGMDEEQIVISQECEKAPDFDTSKFTQLTDYKVTINCGCDDHNNGFYVFAADYGEVRRAPLLCHKDGRWIRLYTDSALKNEVSQDIQLTEDMQLYSKWELNCTITLVDKANNRTETIILTSDGYAAGRPNFENPGYIKDGWYLDAEFNTKFDGSTYIFDGTDFTIYLKWVADTREKHDVSIIYMLDGKEYSGDVVKIAHGDLLEERMLPGYVPSGCLKDGYYSDKDLTKPFDFSQPITAATSIYVKLIADTRVDCIVTVICGIDGHEHIYKVQEGDFFWERPNCEKEGMKHGDDYYLDSALTQVYNKQKITANTDLYVEWVADNRFTVTFVDPYGKLSHTVKVEKELYIKTNGEKMDVDGVFYYLDGWYLNENLDPNTKVEGVLPIYEDTFIYANWVKDTREWSLVEYVYADPLGKEIILSKDNVLQGTFIDVDPYYGGGGSVLEGLRFEGWYYDVDFKNAVAQRIEITKNTRIYGKFVKDDRPDVKVYFVTIIDGAEVPLYTKICKAGDIPFSHGGYFSPQDIPGYDFKGWYTDTDYKIEFDWNSPIYKDTEVYAWYEKNPNGVVTITVECGVDGHAHEYTVTHGAKFNVYSLNCHKPNHDFLGVFWDKECTDEYNGSNITENITLYIKWQKWVVVEFIDDMGELSQTMHLSPDKEFEIPNRKEVVVKDGIAYLFAGWYTSTAYEKEISGYVTITQDTKYFAKWEKDIRKDVIVKYMYVNGNTAELISVVVAKEGDAVHSSYFEYKEMQLLGWYSDISCNDEYLFVGNVNNDITLYGKFKQKNIVSFVYIDNKDGEVLLRQDSLHDGERPHSWDPNNTLELTDMLFVGWFKDENFLSPFNFDTPIFGDTRIYAKIIPGTRTLYTVTVVCGEHTDHTFSVREGEEFNRNNYEYVEISEHGHSQDTKFLGMYMNSDYIVECPRTLVIYKDTSLYIKSRQWNTCTVKIVCGIVDHDHSVAVKEGTSYENIENVCGTASNKYLYWDQSFDKSAGTVEKDSTVYLCFGYTVNYVAGEKNWEVKYYPGHDWLLYKPCGNQCEPSCDPFHQHHLLDTDSEVVEGDWYTDKGLTQRFNFNSYRIREDITLYGKLVAREQYTVTVKCGSCTNGHTFTVAAHRDLDVEAVKIALAKCAPEGMVLEYLYSENGGHSYSPITIYSNRVYYVRWYKGDITDTDKATFTVTFNCGIKEHSHVTKVKEGANYFGKEQVCTPEGLIFDGYYYERTINIKYDGTIRKDTTLYAKWVEAEIYTVTFVDELGALGGTPQNIIAQTQLTLPHSYDNVLVNDTQYKFNGWYTSEDFAEKSRVNGQILVVEASITLYAKYDIVVPVETL